MVFGPSSCTVQDDNNRPLTVSGKRIRRNDLLPIALTNQLSAEPICPESITTTDMVFYKERDNERPPLSLILPHLYLGAETDVTQECLNSRGISYVLSVSRCSPQPTFVPRSQFLRIPIDDSLWDDLLAWIPAALRFIDGAVSSGGSVLVHCAAGISRSPALAVAYIMYSLGMDLDHAYRFVKERRPSISPNFNFLGQLQHFQGALSQKAYNGGLVIQPLKPLNDNNNHSFTGSPAANKVIDLQGSSVTNDGTARADQTYSQKLYNAEQRYSQSGKVGKGSILSGTPQSEQNSPHATLSLSGKLRTLHISLNQNQREVQTIYDSSNASSYESAKPTPKPLNLQLPACNSSLLEKRKGLTLSLSPLGTTPIAFNNAIMRNACSPTESSPQCSGSSKYIKQRELASGRHSNKPAELLCYIPVETPAEREMSSCGGKYARSGHVSPQDQVKPDRDGKCQGRKATSCSHGAGRKSKDALVQNKGKDPISNLVQHKGKCSTRRRADTKCSTIVHQQPSAETRLALCDLDPEVSNEDSGLLSHLNLTINKLLGWGERMLLGVLLGPRIKMGHVALPYRC